MLIMVGVSGEEDIVPLSSTLREVPESAEIIAVSVIPSNNPFGALAMEQLRLHNGGKSLREARLLEAKEASETLDRFQMVASESNKNIRTVLLRGNPAGRLLSLANKENVDFLIATRQQPSAENPYVLGNVASRIARYAKCSVLVVNPGSPSPKSMLLATDGSSQAMIAGERLRELFVRGGRDLLIGSITPVFESAFVKTGSSSFTIYDRFVDELRGNQLLRSQAIVDSEEERFRGFPFAIRKQALSGDTVGILLHLLQSGNMDLLIIGAKGWSRTRRFLLGSVSWKLLNRAACSILIGR